MKWYFKVSLAIIPVALTHYYHVATIKVKDPTFIVNDYAKQQIISQEVIGTAPLQITKPDGTEIKGSVYSETFYFFNQGNEAIKPQHVLENISVFLSDTASEIIDFKILKESRTVAGLKLVPDSVRKNKLNIQFRILEKNDGLMGQVIYASVSNPSLQLGGAIEGASKGFSDHYKGDFLFLNITVSTLFTFLVFIVAAIGLFLLIKYVFGGYIRAVPEQDQPESDSDADGGISTITKAKGTLGSALTTRYQLIIRNEDNFAEKTSLGFTYAKLIQFSFFLFFAVFGMTLFLVETVLERWFDPRYVKPKQPALDLPETLSFIIPWFGW